jgi:tRNA(Ile2)-agmatinylcytidine synthase
MQTNSDSVVSDHESIQDKESLHIGIDDTDSLFGKCTTHLAFKITEYILQKTQANFIDYPLLIRLNPNIPWKTRGNGAVCLRISANIRDQQRIIDFVKKHVESNSEIDSGANPGIAFFRGNELPGALLEFSRWAMFEVIKRQDAIKLAEKTGVEYFMFGNGRGLVGALASVGCFLDRDHTFEAIAYRRPENCGTQRKIDADKVIQFTKATFPYTFNNYDFDDHRMLIAPHGADPVFCGIRGEDADIVTSSLRSLDIEEKPEGCMVYRSNQGTNMHLQNTIKLSEPKSYTSGYIRCKVGVKPHTTQGGHTFFAVENDGLRFQVAVYEPTGLTNVASLLVPGDIVEVGGGIRRPTSNYPKVLNLEYLLVLGLASVVRTHNPLCKHCVKRMKSEGKCKGFQCTKCKFKEPATVVKEVVELPRKISPGIYIPKPKAHRHLTKPLQRYGLEKKSLTGPVKCLSSVIFQY